MFYIMINIYIFLTVDLRKINGKSFKHEIARGKLVNDRIENLEILISTEPKRVNNIGSRLVIKNNFYLGDLVTEVWV